MNKNFRQIRIKRKRFLLLHSPLFNKLIIKRASVSVNIIGKFLKNKIIFIPSSAMAYSFYKRISHWLKMVVYGSFVELKTEGVGLKFCRYYAAPQLLVLTLGFSHTILFKIPKKVKFRCLKYRLLLFSFDLKELRNTALRLRAYRPPDPYKGKGVKFVTEGLKLKPGKQRQR